MACDKDSPNKWSRPGGLIPKMVVHVFSALVLLLGLFGCNRHDGSDLQSGQRQPDLAVIFVEPKEVPVTFEFVAQVRSSRQVNIHSRVSGFLEKRVYTEGSLVKEGETLFLMDQKPLRAQLDRASAALARERAAFDVARQNLERVKPLAAANALSAKDLDDAVGRFQSTAAAVEQAKAAVEQAQLNLSYTVITTPVTGIAGAAEQADGTYLNPANSELTTVAVISPVYVNFSISENDRLRFRKQIADNLLIEPDDGNYVVEVVLADGSIYPHTGKVTFADPSFDPDTGTFLVRATVENPDGLLRPNQYAHVRIKGAVRPHAILVPQRAVMQSSKGHFVWVVDKEDKAEMRPVVVGEWQDTDWFIYEGLRAGDRVAVEGVLGLHPGMPVKVHPMAGKNGAAGTSPQGPAPETSGR